MACFHAAKYRNLRPTSFNKKTTRPNKRSQV